MADIFVCTHFSFYYMFGDLEYIDLWLRVNCSELCFCYYCTCLLMAWLQLNNSPLFCLGSANNYDQLQLAALSFHCTLWFTHTHSCTHSFVIVCCFVVRTQVSNLTFLQLLQDHRNRQFGTNEGGQLTYLALN